MRFTKIQATGNDFILIEAGEEHDWSSLAETMCHRHLGVGADGLIVIIPSKAVSYTHLTLPTTPYV